MSSSAPDPEAHGTNIYGSVDHTYLGGLNLPKFLAKHGYEEPVDLTKFDNYTEVYGKPYWDRCENEPAVAESFRAISKHQSSSQRFKPRRNMVGSILPAKQYSAIP